MTSEAIQQFFLTGVVIAAVLTVVWFIASWSPAPRERFTPDLKNLREVTRVLAFLAEQGITGQDRSYTDPYTARKVYSVSFEGRVNGLDEFITEMQSEKSLIARLTP
jgi:hypothetical protein